MSGDATLNRLKIFRDIALRSMQEAYESLRAASLSGASSQQLLDDFCRKKAAYDASQAAYISRREDVKAYNKHRAAERRVIALRAGVPAEYADSVHVAYGPTGKTSVYYGGEGRPDGPGHGHIVLDNDGRVIYWRNPSDPHGTQNYISHEDGCGCGSGGGPKTTCG